MSSLSQAINEMRNMRESYDQLSAAAEAYNTGKAELAANITSKGVQASADETLPELAEKVSAILQETLQIDGGEMYAKQLFGSLETPNYWNLYEVLANLLCDGRLVSYGGILLAEYYRGYDSLALAGAGAGGAYVVSDKNADGQFIMYTEDITHTWATEFDGYGNRWVAYCFANEYHDFPITDTNTSPRRIFIGRKVGTIITSVTTRTSELIVPDGNELNAIYGNNSWQFGNNVIIRNIKSLSGFTGSGTKYSIFMSAKESIGSFKWSGEIYGLILQAPLITGRPFEQTNSITAKSVIIDAEVINGVLFVPTNGTFTGQAVYVIGCERVSAAETHFSIIYNWNTITYLYLGYKTNDKNRSINLRGYYENTKPARDVELQDGWCKPVVLSDFKNMTEENMYAHILQRLKQDEPDCGDGVTITIGQTNLDKLTSEESLALLDELTNTYGYTFA